MPYDSYSEEPEPKLLTLDCFPTFFTPPAPPQYEVIMAANTRYHRLPEDNHASFEAPTRDPELLLGPLSGAENPAPPKKGHKFSYHPTLFLRLVVVGLLVASLILFVIARRPRSLSAIIFVCIVLVRNVLVVFHSFVARFIRIRIDVELVSRPSDPKKPTRGCPSWLKKGPIHVALDLILAFILLITVIIATQGSYHWDQRSVVPACILTWVAIPLFAVSAADMGNPSTITGTICFDYSKDKKPELPELPRVYRDVEAADGPGLQSQPEMGTS